MSKQESKEALKPSPVFKTLSEMRTNDRGERKLVKGYTVLVDRKYEGPFETVVEAENHWRKAVNWTDVFLAPLREEDRDRDLWCSDDKHSHTDTDWPYCKTVPAQTENTCIRHTLMDLCVHHSQIAIL